jgi:hypothetical protein
MDKLPILNERLYLRSPSINVCFRVTLEGSLDKNTIEKALKKVCIRHPLINCSVKIDNNNSAWFVQNGGSSAIEYFEFLQGESPLTADITSALPWALKYLRFL